MSTTPSLGAKGNVRTFELHLQPRLTTEDGDLRVVTLVHERAEHRARGGAVRVAHYVQTVTHPHVLSRRLRLPMAIFLQYGTHVSNDNSIIQ